MKKVSVYWQGDGYSCFWNPEKGVQCYHPNMQRDVLHEQYGGENYYTSQTELSGAGYLLLDPKNILVEFGYYRTDVHMWRNC